MDVITRGLLIGDLKADEGIRLKPYRDTVGKLTKGIGRNLDDVGISRIEALSMLEEDIDGVIHNLNIKLPWWEELPEDLQRALLNMCFNLGIRRFLGFKRMLSALEEGNYEVAAAEALDSKWAKQVGNRAIRIADLIRNG